MDIFQKHGHTEVSLPTYAIKLILKVRVQVDTARFYGRGTSEEMLAQIDWQKRGLVMETKLYPTAVCVAPSIRIDTSLITEISVRPSSKAGQPHLVMMSSTTAPRYATLLSSRM